MIIFTSINTKQVTYFTKMGGAKQNYLEDLERGFSVENNLYVCEYHFQDKDILEYFSTNGDIRLDCSFCENVETQKISWNELLEIIVPCIRYFYDDPANGLSYISAEGGYIGNTYDTLELLQDVIGLDADFEIIEEISDSILQDAWTEAEFYGESYSNQLIYNWKSFEALVKYKVRYIFNDIEDKDVFDYRYRPFLILKDIGDFIKKLNLIVSIPEKNNLFNQEISFYRARQHRKEIRVDRCIDIGSAPSQYAGSNRFSAEGISIFYGAEDEETAIKEIIISSKTDDIVSTGRFIPNKDLNLIDLRNIEPIGFFKKEQLELIEPTKFLMEFVKNISKKTTNDSNQRIDYVPSQIVTEFFRFVLPKTIGKEIHGIVYKSTLNPGKDCFAIFADGTQCSDEENLTNEVILYLKKDSIIKKIVGEFNKIEQ